MAASDIRFVLSLLSRRVLVELAVAALILGVSSFLLAQLPLLAHDLRGVLAEAPSSSPSPVTASSPMPDSSFELLFPWLMREAASAMTEQRELFAAGAKVAALLLAQGTISLAGHVLVERAAHGLQADLLRAAVSASLDLDFATRIATANADAFTAAQRAGVTAFRSACVDALTNTVAAIATAGAAAYSLAVLAPPQLAAAIAVVACGVIAAAWWFSSSSSSSRKESAASGSDAGGDDADDTIERAVQRVVAAEAREAAFHTGIIDRFATIRVGDAKNVVTSRHRELLDAHRLLAASASRRIHFRSFLTSSTLTLVAIGAAVVALVLQRRGHLDALVDLTIIGINARMLVTALDSAQAELRRLLLSIAKLAPLIDLLRHAECDRAEARARESLLFVDDADASSGVLLRATAVSAGYVGNPTALRDATLLRPIRGEDIVLLRGMNGSAKSTFAKVVCGLLHSPTAGALQIRRGTRMCVMEQSAALICGLTLAENIALAVLAGGESAETMQADVISAAKEARCFDCIQRLPLAFATRVDNGITLSGGETQRVCLARMIFRVKRSNAPCILVLDEPEGALDVESQATMRAVVRRLCAAKDRLIAAIVISHQSDDAASASWGDSARVVRFVGGIATEK